ncbi:L,D-transpeptidase family protein [Brevibacterium sp.]|uniref:L,D-transpeptidase family protein n=1 Tax=Brevibacterium sp. TaxID=1701 RepID=UPI002811B605|nr:L,D-transpeptidase family protein [Brevibacterium sp.]
MSIAAPAQQAGIGDIAAPAQNDPSGAPQSPAPNTSPADSNGSAQPHAVPVPGLGPQTAALIPEETSQVLVASAANENSVTGELSVYRFEDKQWKKLKTFDFHNGSNGWLKDRREGDETTPIGVFTLSDAGGDLPDPGAKLPYSHDPGLSASASVAYGERYDRVFDYVVAIDYNRVPGKPPTDRTRPMGWDKGGGIWLHLDHGSATHGCVTLKEKDLRWLLRNLDPDAHPRIAMGPDAELRK